MLNFGNKEFRNLQEQVLKNMQDIQDIEQGATILADFGIKVVGQVNSVEDLPDPAEYKGEYGDAYLVGTEKPYNYYIFTRAFEGQEEPSWFDLGEFPVPGPQGAQGVQGPVGDTPVIGATVGSVSTLNPGQSATASVSVSGTAAQPTMTFNFAIPQGAQGIQGATGPQGPQGPRGLQGEKGEKGEQGGLIDIVGIVATADLLPAPSTLQKLDAAYLVGASPDYELYVQVGETPSTALWTNLGAVNEGTVVTINGTPQTVWEAASKVSVSDGYLMNTLYGQAAGTGNGQTHVPYGTAATANYIPQRDLNGQILVPETPTANNMAASKAYVDANAGGQSPIQYAGDLIVGNSQGEESRLAIGSAGQVLTVNSIGNGLEYTDIEGVPSYTNTDANKSLKVNSAGTALEWGTAGGGLVSNLVDTADKTIPQIAYLTKTGNEHFKLASSANTTANIKALGGGVLLLTNSDASTQTNKSINIGNHSNLTNNDATCVGILGLKYLSTAPQENRRNIPVVNNGLCFGGLNTATNSSLVVENSLAVVSDSFERAAAYQYGDYYSPKLSNSILVGGSFGNTQPYQWNYSIGNGVNLQYGGGRLNLWYSQVFGNETGNTVSGSGNKGLYNITIFGGGHEITYGSEDFRNKGLFMAGYYGIYNNATDAGDKFIIGAGTSTSARANCFVAGTNSTDGDYIKIGDTKLTEAKLQALLALLS